MSPPRWTTLVLGGVAAVVALALVPGDAVPPGTTVSTAPGGLRGAVVLTDTASTQTRSWRQPWNELPMAAVPAPGLLVLTLPLARTVPPAEQDALSAWLDAGHHVLVQTSGERSDVPGWLARPPFRLSLVPISSPELAAPSDWWEPTLLASPAGAEPVRLPRANAVFSPRDHDHVAFEGIDGMAIRTRPMGSGQIHLVDGPLLRNRWLGRSDGAATWWQDTAGASTRVFFDDYHQGLVDAVAASPPATWPTRLLLLHLIGLWLVGVWSLARPFGTRPTSPTPPRSSIAGELRTLARLHARAGHAAGAIDQLLRSARGPGPIPEPSGPPSDTTLLDLARELARRQHRGLLQ